MDRKTKALADRKAIARVVRKTKACVARKTKARVDKCVARAKQSSWDTEDTSRGMSLLFFTGE